jgi:hypothetical protein
VESVRRIRRPNGTFFVRRRRHGVEPSGGCIIGFPIWLLTRLGWHGGRQRQWALELSVAPASRLGGFNKLVERTLWDSRDQADEAARLLIERLGRGELDELLPAKDPRP